MGHVKNVDCSYRFDVGLETQPQIKAKQRLCDNDNLSTVVNDNKSWFTRMEELDPIHH
jgi:hypothetical protein